LLAAVKVVTPLQKKDAIALLREVVRQPSAIDQYIGQYIAISAEA
jgi:hypothetical protein